MSRGKGAPQFWDAVIVVFELSPLPLQRSLLKGENSCCIRFKLMLVLIS